MRITLNKIKAANIVAKNWRLHNRFPRITRLVGLLNLTHPETVDAWLVYESEYDIHPVCMLYEPKDYITDFFKVNKIKIIKGNINE